jgi:hypothetical protein
MSVLPAEGDRPDRPLDDVRVQLEPAVLEEQHQPRPVAQGVADRRGEGGAPGDPPQLDREPGVQGLDHRLAALLPDRASLLGGTATDLRLHFVELADPAQRLVEAPPAMRPTERELDPVRRAARQQALEA